MEGFGVGVMGDMCFQKKWALGILEIVDGYNLLGFYGDCLRGYEL